MFNNISDSALNRIIIYGVLVFSSGIVICAITSALSKRNVIYKYINIICWLMFAFSMPATFLAANEVRSRVVKDDILWRSQNGPDYTNIIARVLPYGVNTNDIISADAIDMHALASDARLSSFPLLLMDGIYLYEAAPPIERKERIEGWHIVDKEYGYSLLHQQLYNYDFNIRKYIPIYLRSIRKTDTQQLLVLRTHFVYRSDATQPGRVGRLYGESYDHYITVIDIPSERISPSIEYRNKHREYLTYEQGAIVSNLLVEWHAAQQGK